MYKPKKKPSSLNLGKLTTKVLRLLRADKFPASSFGQEESPDEISYSNSYQVSETEIRNACLNAEYLKAQALLERQKHPQFY